MARTTLILWVAIFSSCRVADFSTISAEIKFLQLHGKIAKVQIVVIRKRAEDPYSKDTIKSEFFTLDQKGNTIAHTIKRKLPTDSPDSALFSFESESYGFDNRGRLKTSIQEFDGTNTHSRFTYHRRRLFATDVTGNSCSKTFSTYDRHARVTSTEQFHPDGFLNARDEIYYFAHGKQIESVSFDRNGLTLHKRISCDDTVGDKVFNYMKDSGIDNSESITISTINAHRKLESQLELDEDLRVMLRKSWQYDNKGNEVGYNEYDNTGTLIAQKTCSYNYNNNAISKCICNYHVLPVQAQEQVEQTIFFDFDQNNNYQKKIVTYPKDLHLDTTFEFRSFSYYK